MNADQELAVIADYLEEHGHARGSYLRPDGSACVIGALYVVRGSRGSFEAMLNDIDDTTVNRIRELAKKQPRPWTIMKWSDETPTAELLAQLRGAS